MTEQLSPDELLQMITAYQSSQVIYSATYLGIPDLLAGGPRSSETLAAETGTQADSLHRLLRMLAAIGIVSEAADGAVQLTETGALLRSGVAGSLRDRVLFLAGPWYWKSWGDLLYSLRSGEPAFQHIFGMTNFEFWESDHEAGAAHDRFFTSTAALTNRALVSAYDFQGLTTVADIGGSEGPLLAAILAANPHLRGVLFDLPHVVTGAASVLDHAGVADRCTVVGGDFFDSVPSGADAYILKYILHDWDDERASRILARLREAAPPGTRLLVIEQVLGDRLEFGSAALQGARLDLQMLVLTPGGRERTEAQYRALLDAARFRVERLIPTRSPFTIIEALAY